MLNREQFHQECLDDMVKCAWAYGKRRGVQNSKATVWRYQADTDPLDPVIEAIATFPLPHDSGKLCLEMAKFARTSLSNTYSLVNSDYETIPEPLFCLMSLLESAFPKDVWNDKFKGHDCAASVGEIPEGHPEIEPFIAFAGIGTILMRQCGRNDLLPNADIIKNVYDQYLSIDDRGYCQARSNAKSAEAGRE